MSALHTSSSPAFAGEGDRPSRRRPRSSAVNGGGGAVRRLALLGGPDAPDRLREADAENEARELNRGLAFYLTVVLAVALWFAWSWSENGLADLWNLVWFIPLVLFGALIWYGFEELGGALCRQAARPFRTHKYTPNFYGDEEEDDSDFATAEMVDDETGTGKGGAAR